MALIKCKECGKEISDQAASCPNCGAPVGKQETPPDAKRGTSAVNEQQNTAEPGGDTNPGKKKSSKKYR